MTHPDSDGIEIPHQGPFGRVDHQIDSHVASLNQISAPPQANSNPLLWDENPSPHSFAPRPEYTQPTQTPSSRPPPPVTNRPPPPTTNRPPPPSNQPPGPSGPPSLSQKDSLLNTRVQVASVTHVPEVHGNTDILSALIRDTGLFEGSLDCRRVHQPEDRPDCIQSNPR
jgi:hypothetical protein